MVSLYFIHLALEGQNKQCISLSAGLSGVLNSKIFGSYRKYKYIYRYLVSFYL